MGSRPEEPSPQPLSPPCAKLLGWHLLDARPKDGWIRIGFDGKQDFCNPAGFVQGGMLSAMLDDTMGPAVFAMTDGGSTRRPSP